MIKLLILLWATLYAYVIMYTFCRALSWILIILTELGYKVMPERFMYRDEDDDSRLSKAEIHELRTIAQSSLIVRKVILRCGLGFF
jgi:hypothetical protein